MLQEPSVPVTEGVGKAGECWLPGGLRERAGGGDPEAQFEVGSRMHFLLEVGRSEVGGVPGEVGLGQRYEASEGEAVRWYERAAKKGHAWAQFALGALYMTGWQPRYMRKPDVALSWLKLAAGQGLAEAQWYVGLMLLFGEGTERNEARALQSLHEAADRGHKGALSDLSVCYLTGWGTEVDERRGMALLQRSQSKEQGPRPIPSYFPVSTLPRPPGHVSPEVPYLLSDCVQSRLKPSESSEPRTNTRTPELELESLGQHTLAPPPANPPAAHSGTNLFPSPPKMLPPTPPKQPTNGFSCRKGAAWEGVIDGSDSAVARNSVGPTQNSVLDHSSFGADLSRVHVTGGGDNRMGSPLRGVLGAGKGEGEAGRTGSGYSGWSEPSLDSTHRGWRAEKAEGGDSNHPFGPGWGTPVWDDDADDEGAGRGHGDWTPRRKMGQQGVQQIMLQAQESTGGNRRVSSSMGQS